MEPNKKSSSEEIKIFTIFIDEMGKMIYIKYGDKELTSCSYKWNFNDANRAQEEKRNNYIFDTEDPRYETFNKLLSKSMINIPDEKYKCQIFGLHPKGDKHFAYTAVGSIIGYFLENKENPHDTKYEISTINFDNCKKMLQIINNNDIQNNKLNDLNYNNSAGNNK